MAGSITIKSATANRQQFKVPNLIGLISSFGVSLGLMRNGLILHNRVLLLCGAAWFIANTAWLIG